MISCKDPRILMLEQQNTIPAIGIAGDCAFRQNVVCYTDTNPRLRAIGVRGVFDSSSSIVQKEQRVHTHSVKIIVRFGKI